MHYYAFDNSLLFTESIQNAANLSTLNHNVRFLPCQHRGVGFVMQCRSALNLYCIILIIPGHSREVPRRGPVDIVNPGILCDSSHLTYINKY